MHEIQSHLHPSYRIVAGEVFTRVDTDYMIEQGAAISVFISHKSAGDSMVSDSGWTTGGDW